MIAALLTAFTLANTYPRAMEIVEIDRNADVAICVDAVGMEWSFTGPEDLEVGDMVICIMYNNGTTDTIVDDEVVDVYWSGYFYEGNDFKSIGQKRSEKKGNTMEGEILAAIATDDIEALRIIYADANKGNVHVESDLLGTVGIIIKNNSL